MPRTRRAISALLSCVCVLGLSGCSDVPPEPPRFQIDPQKAAQAAFASYDKNHDGTLDAKELDASPPLKEMLENLKTRDSGHPGSLSAADVAGRLQEWIEAPVILVPSTFMVTLDGKLLDGATVTFEPESFLGASYHAHHGTTDAAGMVDLDPELPEYPNLIYVGLYRVRVSKMVGGQEVVPSQYNVETTLGRELATDVRDHRESVFLRLTSK